MEALEDLDRERGQAKPGKRTKLIRCRLILRVLLVLAPLLTKLVQLGVEIMKALR
jgi:hypothetical protein